VTAVWVAGKANCIMGIIKPWKWLPIMGAVVLLPASSPARPASCAGLAPTYPANYSEEASLLLQGMGDDARQVAAAVQELKPFANNGVVSWEFQVQKLAGIQLQVNDMSNKLCRLDTIQRVVAGSQQATIHAVEPHVPRLVATAQNALHHVNSRQGNLWTPAYQTETQDLFKEATVVAARISHDEQLAQLRATEAALEESPGVDGK
jgi:hypothetical protein